MASQPFIPYDPRVQPRRFGLFLVALWTFPALAQAANREIGPADDAAAAIAQLKPGDELVLRGGTYELSGRFGIDLAGTERQPVVIRAKAGERPHFHRPGSEQNIVDIDRADFVVLRGIELSGGSAGIRVVAARHLTIEACEIHDTGDVALRANEVGARYEGLRILRNHIHHTNGTGEGMYLGCNNNGCQVLSSLIEGNYVHHTNQATVVQGDGIELKEGSANNVLRDNVVHDTNYPCILTYSAAGNGAANIIERNMLFRCGDHAIQSAADAIIRNNIILSASSDGIALQPHQSGTPSGLVVVNNTVIDADGTGISLRNPTGSVIVANNAVFTNGAAALNLATGAGVVIEGNVVQGSGGGQAGELTRDVTRASFSGGPPNDVYPKAGAVLVGHAVRRHLPTDDFNGTLREGTLDIGAYAFAASGNPGWVLAEAMKPGAPARSSPGSGTGVTVSGPDRPTVTTRCGCRTTRPGPSTRSQHFGLFLLLLCPVTARSARSGRAFL